MVNDDEIERRLRQLREDETLIRLTKNVDLQREIEQRLARLTNRDPSFYSSAEPPVKLLLPKRTFKTDDEEADNLMDRFMNELKLDDTRTEYGHEVDREIERRLKELKKEQLANSKSKDKQESNIKHRKSISKHRQLIQQIVGAKVHHDEDSDPDEDDDRMNVDETVDWCTTCNEDGAVRCVDCDNDIYCRECFRELHRDPDLKGHSFVPYKKKSQK